MRSVRGFGVHPWGRCPFRLAKTGGERAASASSMMAMRPLGRVGGTGKPGRRGRIAPAAVRLS